MRIIALSGKIFTLSWLLVGFENFAINSVPTWARIENYRAMIEAGMQFGHYPIYMD